MKISLKTTAWVGLATGFANGLFGSGGGTLLVPALQKFFHTETHKSHATALSVILPLTVLSALLYVFRGETAWSTVMWVALGGVPGGFVGAKVLNKVPTKWLHVVFGGLMAFAAVRMIF